MAAQIYVGTYAKYNNGSINGAWLKLEDYADAEEFHQACLELHKDEEDPELMFQDYEGFPRAFYGECSLSPALWDWLELSDDDRELLEAFQEVRGDTSATLEDAQDACFGKYESVLAFAEEYIESTGMLSEVHESIARYFDYESFARDLMYDYSESNGYYFSNN